MSIGKGLATATLLVLIAVLIARLACENWRGRADDDHGRDRDCR